MFLQDEPSRRLVLGNPSEGGDEVASKKDNEESVAKLPPKSNEDDDSDDENKRNVQGEKTGKTDPNERDTEGDSSDTSEDWDATSKVTCNRCGTKKYEFLACVGCKYMKNLLTPNGPMGGKLGTCSKCYDVGPAGHLCRNDCQSMGSPEAAKEEEEKYLALHPKKYALTRAEIEALEERNFEVFMIEQRREMERIDIKTLHERRCRWCAAERRPWAESCDVCQYNRTRFGTGETWRIEDPEDPEFGEETNTKKFYTEPPMSAEAFYRQRTLELYKFMKLRTELEVQFYSARPEEKGEDGKVDEEKLK
jgi:hypothetical protein